MTPRRHDPAKEQFRRQVVTRWRCSGLNVRATCARESLSEPSFYDWRPELARRGGDAPGVAAWPFVAVKVVEPPPPKATPAEAPAPAPSQPATSKGSGGHDRRQLPSDLPRHRGEIPVPALECNCPGCGQPRHKIGEEVTEQLDDTPASLFVLQHVSPKLACRPNAARFRRRFGNSEKPAIATDEHR